MKILGKWNFIGIIPSVLFQFSFFKMLKSIPFSFKIRLSVLRHDTQRLSPIVFPMLALSPWVTAAVGAGFRDS